MCFSIVKIFTTLVRRVYTLRFLCNNTIFELNTIDCIQLSVKLYHSGDTILYNIIVYTVCNAFFVRFYLLCAGRDKTKHTINERDWHSTQICVFRIQQRRYTYITVQSSVKNIHGFTSVCDACVYITNMSLKRNQNNSDACNMCYTIYRASCQYRFKLVLVETHKVRKKFRTVQKVTPDFFFISVLKYTFYH